MKSTVVSSTKSRLIRSSMKSAGFELGATGRPISARYSASSAAAPRKHTLSKPANTDVDGWCTVHTIATPSAGALSFRNVMIDAAAAASSPDVGSSRNTMLGSLVSATASDKRRRWPPESPLMNWLPAFTCWHAKSPISFSTASTYVSASRDGW
eukprot:3765127-Prymnesium_polylepis.2